ncbi:MAG: HlyD family efflux transporter periplasmic adaptor subunit [Planctomycetota bacterium]|nr:HlyD family efflux transporter periplasmic adaptor subunit [Planctomycetota bacterium]
MATEVDLRQLAVKRPQSGVGAVSPRRSWLLRWVLPLAVVLGFVALIGWSARDLWLPAAEVTVVPVILTRADVQTSGTPLFQAAGWVEPRPTAVACSAMVEGVVKELLVVAGQEVKVGEPVAIMIDTEVRLRLREAESLLQLRKAEKDATQAGQTATKRNLEQPVHLEAATAEADAALAELETEIKNLPFQVQGIEARLLLAKQSLDGKKAVGDAISGRSLQAAQSEFDSATAALAELKQRQPGLLRQHEAWQRKCEALRTKLELKTEERRAYDEATAHLAAAEARLNQASLGVESAKLQLDWMTIRSPINGRVLSLESQPGQRLMGLNSASQRDASTVATLYDPDKLQVRVDVRLEDVQQVLPGQPVQITTAALKEPLSGTVLGVTSQADIQKNTLQVKVSIDSAAKVVRPEMLAQVTFLAPEQVKSGFETEQNAMRMLVSKELVITKDGSAGIWVVDAEEPVARLRNIHLGRASTEKLVEVVQGLNALDKLIATGREGLQDGDRVRVATSQ